jgi:hypothetical protein
VTADPNGIRLELLEFAPDSLQKKAIHSWRLGSRRASSVREHPVVVYLVRLLFCIELAKEASFGAYEATST